MSKSLLIDYNIFEVSQQMISESEQRNGGRVIVSGVLQRAIKTVEFIQKIF
mgnify:CR=1 FL=1